MRKPAQILTLRNTKRRFKYKKFPLVSAYNSLIFNIGKGLFYNVKKMKNILNLLKWMIQTFIRLKLSKLETNIKVNTNNDLHNVKCTNSC